MHFPLRAPSPPQLRPKGMHYMPTRIPAYRKGPEVAEVPNSLNICLTVLSFTSPSDEPAEILPVKFHSWGTEPAVRHHIWGGLLGWSRVLAGQCLRCLLQDRSGQTSQQVRTTSCCNGRGFSKTSTWVETPWSLAFGQGKGKSHGKGCGKGSGKRPGASDDTVPNLAAGVCERRALHCGRVV